MRSQGVVCVVCPDPFSIALRPLKKKVLLLQKRKYFFLNLSLRLKRGLNITHNTYSQIQKTLRPQPPPPANRPGPGGAAIHTRPRRVKRWTARRSFLTRHGPLSLSQGRATDSPTALLGLESRRITRGYADWYRAATSKWESDRSYFWVAARRHFPSGNLRFTPPERTGITPSSHPHLSVLGEVARGYRRK